MAYIQNQEHFINFLNKFLRESSCSNIQQEQLLPAQFYIEHIYNAGYADEFCWSVRTEGVELLAAEKTLAWLEKTVRPAITYDEYNFGFDEDFLRIIADLEKKPGVYSFWSHGVALYVGKSVNLSSRIKASLTERFTNFNQPIYVRHIVTDTEADASILEIHFINSMRPPFNREHNSQNATHRIKLDPVPEWSEPILCTKEEEGNG